MARLERRLDWQPAALLRTFAPDSRTGASCSLRRVLGKQKDPYFAGSLQAALDRAAASAAPRPEGHVLAFSYPGSFRPDAVLSLAHSVAIYDSVSTSMLTCRRRRSDRVLFSLMPSTATYSAWSRPLVGSIYSRLTTRTNSTVGFTPSTLLRLSSLRTSRFDLSRPTCHIRILAQLRRHLGDLQHPRRGLQSPPGCSAVKAKTRPRMGQAHRSAESQDRGGPVRLPRHSLLKSRPHRRRLPSAKVTAPTRR